jgi:hypothetical protein
MGPRIVQLMFYILSAVYLYRTIHLFHEKEKALLGATIYLFSPIIFSFASQAALETGVVFCIILISYYFLRFIKYEDNRDLILTTFFIGIGFLYKRGALVMFFVCFAYLMLSRIKKRDWKSIIHFKVLLLSLVPILPWMKIGPSVPPVWSNLLIFDELITFSLMLQSQMSVLIFISFSFSLVFILLTKRDDLSLFFGLLFIVYYFLFTVMLFGKFNHRYAMALYPAIAVFLALAVFSITRRIRWRHAFKLVGSVLIIFLIVISLVPRSNSNLTTYKYKDFETQYFPIDEATDWIKDRTENKDKILVLYLSFYKFYVDKIYPDKNLKQQREFIFYSFGRDVKEIIYPLQNLMKFSNAEKISYIMFPFSPNNSLTSSESNIEQMELTKYLKENMDNKFEKVAKFNLEDNYLFIYKARE